MNAESIDNKFPDIDSNRYRILSVLGTGAVGTVYKAEDVVLAKIVAIKKLHTSAVSQEAVRFQREAKLAGTLDHPNVLSVLDFGLTDKHEPYLVLNFVEGTSLDRRLNDEGPMPASRAIDIFIEIAQGLVYAHGKNLVHRDIKPSNVMLVENCENAAGYVRIVDFGLAKSTIEKQEITRSGVGIGTPIFMSPEQIRGEEVDSRSDIYSFGCLMYETLTGAPPFRTESLLELIELKLHSEPLLASEHAPYPVPQELDRLIDKCLRTEPSERYSSAAEILAELKSINRNEQHQSAEDKQSSGERAPNPVASINWRMAFIVGCGVCALLIPLVCLGYFFVSELGHKPSHQTGVASMFQDAERLNWYRADGATDADLSAFVSQQNGPIEELILRHSKVTPKGLAVLNRKKLKGIHFKESHVPIDIEMYKAVAKIKSLEIFRVQQNPQIDFKGISTLRTLKGLHELDIKYQALDSDALDEIAKIKQLTRVEFGECTGLGGDTLKHIQPLRKVIRLILTASDVDDAGVAALAGMNVEVLNLDFCKVSKECFSELLRFPKLQEVSVSKAENLTQEEFDNFNVNRPHKFRMVFKDEKYLKRLGVNQRL